MTSIDLKVSGKVQLALQEHRLLLEGLKLPVQDALTRLRAADVEMVELMTGSWHQELEALCQALLTDLRGHPVTYVAYAKAMKVRLPELGGLERLIKEVRACWERRPGYLK